MNLNLTRLKANPKGIFGRLTIENWQFVAFTLEHSYDCVPKLAAGDYVCKRGEHTIEDGKGPFITFEVAGVPDFQGVPVTGILIHKGNFNVDSKGCILLGTQSNYAMISNSEKAFEAFMELQEGCDIFNLHVSEAPQPSA